MKKKCISLFLAVVLCFAMAPAALAAGFTDVKPNDYCYNPVLWAVEKGITSGTSDTQFSPNATCTVGQILTFLWRANGEPAPAAANPFTDVKDSDYYAPAARWAHEQKLVSGAALNASAPCTRSMVVTYLWKLSGSEKAPAASFTDVPASAAYAPAVSWAVDKGITSGTTAKTFSPDQTCTRGQIVTFLYRWSGSPAVTAPAEPSGADFAAAHPDVPDFGAMAGVPVDSVDSIEEMAADLYRYAVQAGTGETLLSKYKKLLTDQGFSYTLSKDSASLGKIDFYMGGDNFIGVLTFKDYVGVMVASVSGFLINSVPNMAYYSQCPDIPDFGAITGVPLGEASARADGWYFSYNLDYTEEQLKTYMQALLGAGFEYLSLEQNAYGASFFVFQKGTTTVMFGTPGGTTIAVAVYYK